MKSVAAFLGLLSALLSGLLFVKNRAPKGFILWIPKLFAGALAPLTAVMGGIAAVLGLLTRSRSVVATGSLAALAAGRYVKRTTAPHGGFERAFGPDWQQRISREQAARLPVERWSWTLPPRLPSSGPEPGLESDIPYWTIPGSDRALLCDIWQPAPGAYRSGLAFIYFHGSAWSLLDKDVGTRPAFRRLVRQGHVVMDAAYRLYPEADIPGMVGDVKRAVAWMKANAVRFGVNPERIVIGGGSAGGHIALLAAYAPDQPALTPEDVREAGQGVRGVVSFYGPTDLRVCYYHTNQHLSADTLREKKDAVPASDPRMEQAMRRWMGDNYDRFKMKNGIEAGSFIRMMGGTPEEFPERYALVSPVSYIHPGCPSTLLVQGEDDLITSPAATRQMVQRLQECGVTVVSVFYPQTDHGFELVLPEINPAAQAAQKDLERFLAILS